ncbi:MAG: GNAT family N-acetyltransferase [Chloroflexi bacterium]|nr:GNAT family N-acetyltransferase [Chloroflexota bacterium]
MIHIGLQVRRAEVRDHQQIAGLTFNESRIHRHLDWRTPFEWLGNSNYWVLEDEGHVIAALACPEDPPRVAWLRFFGCHQYFPEHQAWHFLWDAARNDLLQAGDSLTVAAIATKPWFQSMLVSSGFESVQNIVLLDLEIRNMRHAPMPDETRIRSMQDADIPAIAELDSAAFGSFWHNTADSIRRARAQCQSATVVDDDSGVVGYQFSAKNLHGAHLARLGVRPDAQGRGIGSALVSDLIRSFGAGQILKLSVNTQADNVASLSFYKKLGFVRTGEQYSVLVYPIGRP